jgi:hypothetical protein
MLPLVAALSDTFTNRNIELIKNGSEHESFI